MKNINDFIKENIDEVMKQEMDAAEEQYNKKMSHSSELEENYKANLSEQYENDRKNIEDQIKELQNKLNKLDEQKELLQQPLEEKLNDYQRRKEKRETSYQEEYKELLTKANDNANQKEFLLRQKNEEFEKFKDTAKMILKDWGIELVETNTDTKTKFSIVTPDTREIGFSFDYNNPEKPFFFIQDGDDKTEPVREECTAIEATYILKEVALETSRQLKWFKNKDNEFSLNLTRVTENAFKDARDVNYEFDIPRLGKQQEELLEYYNDYFRTQRGDIEQTAEVLSQLEEVNDALTKDEQNTKKKIQEDNEDVTVNDICVILLDDEEYIYSWADLIESWISVEFKWEANKAYISKHTIRDTLLISNRNNVKGLEYPFVICVTKGFVANVQYRNSLYTMLTRSFLKSYLLISNKKLKNIEVLSQNYDAINKTHKLILKKPSEDELAKIETSFKRMSNNRPLADEIRDMLKAKGIPAKQVEMLVKMALDLGWQNLSLEELEENVNKLVSLSNF